MVVLLFAEVLNMRDAATANRPVEISVLNLDKRVHLFCLVTPSFAQSLSVGSVMVAKGAFYYEPGFPLPEGFQLFELLSVIDPLF